jgi:hypothetical protein
MQDTAEYVNSLRWHDSKLKSIRIQHANGVDSVVLDVELRDISDLDLTPATITLQDAVFAICDLDLQGKRECADDISSARCKSESELKDKLQEVRLKYSPGTLKDYCHFHFYLIPPGGTLDVIAAGFTVEPNGPAR